MIGLRVRRWLRWTLERRLDTWRHERFSYFEYALVLPEERKMLERPERAAAFLRQGQT